MQYLLNIHIISQIDELALGLSCKYFYEQLILNPKIYNKLILHRNNRIYNWRYNQTKPSIILDRMVKYKQSRESRLAILIRTKTETSIKFNDGGNIRIEIYYTKNCWKTIEMDYVFTGIYQIFINNNYEQLWLCDLPKYNIKFFCLLFKLGREKYHDDNNGLNYRVGRQYHWIPYFDPLQIPKELSRTYNNTFPSISDWKRGEYISTKSLIFRNLY